MSTDDQLISAILKAGRSRHPKLRKITEEYLHTGCVLNSLVNDCLNDTTLKPQQRELILEINQHLRNTDDPTS